MADPKITGVDWDMINEDAESWARDFGGELVKKIDEGTRRDVGNAVGNFYSEGQTMGELTDRLGRIYSPQRAERIAITEVTRAAAEGERGIAKELAKDGVIMVEVWQTRNDLVVCEICEPRNGVEQGKGSGDKYWDSSQGPPGHPNCRCNIRLDYPKPKEGEVEVQPASPEEIDRLRKEVTSSTHSLEDIISGCVLVGVEGRGGADIIAAQEAGIYTTQVGKTPIYALTEENAAQLVEYLSTGGKYGSVTFSELLGYTETELAIYRRFLIATGRIDLLI